MKKFFVAMGLAAFAFVGCDDSSSASAGPNDEPSVESSSSVEQGSSSGEKAKSSSSKDENAADESSSSVQSVSSSSVLTPKSSSSKDSKLAEGSSSSDKMSVSSSSSVDVLSSSCESVLNFSSSESGVSSSSLDIMTDSRDNKKYKTVKIGNQIWMAENLNFDPGQGGSGEDKYDWSWCYNNVPGNCEKYGRLYTWAAAIDSVKFANDAKPQNCGYKETCVFRWGMQGICPEGWRLPDNYDWEDLLATVGGDLTAGKVLKSQSGWNENGNGTDAFGFSALPAGGMDFYGSFRTEGYHAYFWSASEGSDTGAYAMFMGSAVENSSLGSGNKNNAHSVRCIMD